MVKLFVEVLMLKIFPAVPVAMEVITLGANPIAVEVPMIICLPSPLVKESPEPRLRLPKVEVPMPPRVTDKIPLLI